MFTSQIIYIFFFSPAHVPRICRCSLLEPWRTSGGGGGGGRATFLFLINCPEQRSWSPVTPAGEQDRWKSQGITRVCERSLPVNPPSTLCGVSRNCKIAVSWRATKKRNPLEAAYISTAYRNGRHLWTLGAYSMATVKDPSSVVLVLHVPPICQPGWQEGDKTNE